VSTTIAAVNVLDPTSLINAFGTVGIAAVMFAETGLLIGFFLPGDSLLFAAGVLCATDAGSPLHLSMATALPAAAIGALAGAQTGYLIGGRVGPAVFDRADRPALRRGVDRARVAMERYGAGKAIALARFIPVLRTVINPLAGVLGVPGHRFAAWQVGSGLVWTAGVMVAGFELGSRASHVDDYLLPIVAVVVVVSLIPVAHEVRRARHNPDDAS
jgi:membrane-associated protein